MSQIIAYRSFGGRPTWYRRLVSTSFALECIARDLAAAGWTVYVR